MSGFAGLLNQRVQVQHWVPVSDAMGGDAGQWVAASEAWAAIALIELRPAEDGAAPATRQRFRVTMRDDAAFGLLHRLIWSGKALTVLSVARDPAEADRMRIIAEMRE
mgnify:CR=1 FL=1